MAASDSISSIASSLLAQKSMRLVSWQPIQTLWAGYGHICRLIAASDMSSSINSPFPSLPTCPRDSGTISDPSGLLESETLILKLISPPPADRHSNEGHVRKVLSYNVEQYFYTHLAVLMPPDIPVSKCVASISPSSSQPRNSEAQHETTAMILTDLRPSFPLAGEKRAELNQKQVYASLSWLAKFHGFWWSRTRTFDREVLIRAPLEEVQRPKTKRTGSSVWLHGGYSYLATRRAEYASLAEDEDSEWSESLCIPSTGQSLSTAEKVAKLLAPQPDGMGVMARYETLIHGDVKSENLFTTMSGEEVAFYDFQYVGLGLGVCDLAKLFTCSIPLKMLHEDMDIPEELAMQQGEKELLQRYQETIEQTSGDKYPWDILVKHWETALVDWLRFQASWGFWGNTEWLEARVRYILKNESWIDWVDATIS